MFLRACTGEPVADEDLTLLRNAGFVPGRGLLKNVPQWLLKYVALIVRFVRYEERELPAYVLSDNRRRITVALSKSQTPIKECSVRDAEIEAQGVCENRLQNLAITLSKVRYFLRRGVSGASVAEVPPPLRPVEGEELAQRLWCDQTSIARQVLGCMSCHKPLPEGAEALAAGVAERDATVLAGGRTALNAALFWLRDELKKLKPTAECRHDAAADLVHMYACTKAFYMHREEEPYRFFRSEPIEVRANEISSGIGAGGASSKVVGSVAKAYQNAFVWGQLTFWHKMDIAEPVANLHVLRRGCITLPDATCCYSSKPGVDLPRGYGPKQRAFFIQRLEDAPFAQWQQEKYIWNVPFSQKLHGSPSLDAALAGVKSLDPAVLEWLKAQEATQPLGPADE